MKKILLSESELVSLIKKIINEDVPLQKKIVNINKIPVNLIGDGKISINNTTLTIFGVTMLKNFQLNVADLIPMGDKLKIQTKKDKRYLVPITLINFLANFTKQKENEIEQEFTISVMDENDVISKTDKGTLLIQKTT